MIGESWCTASIERDDGRVIVPPTRIHNAWLLPGRRIAANLAHGAVMTGYRPFIYIAIGLDDTPVPDNRDQVGLLQEIARKAATEITPADTGNVLTLSVDFFGDEVTGQVREVALYNTPQAGGGSAIYRYVYPVALPLASNAKLPILIEVDILNIP